MRRVVLVAAALGVLTLLAAPAWASPVAIHASPGTVGAGGTVTVSGSAGLDCSGDVTLISKAFAHTHDFAGLPALMVPTTAGGAFSATTTIPGSTPAGTYTITGRCGGGNLGVSATLVVRAAAPGGLPRTGPGTARLLPAGLALLGLGAVALGAGRRGRHARRARPGT